MKREREMSDIEVKKTEEIAIELESPTDKKPPLVDENLEDDEPIIDFKNDWRTTRVSV